MQHLRSIGFNISSISEDFPGIDDTKVMNMAIEEERSIITYDSDYGELIFKYGFKPEAGVIYIRIQPEHLFALCGNYRKFYSVASIQI